MPPLSMLIKPASGNCDLRCAYCFYHSLAESRDVKNYGIMSDDTLERIVEKALAFADENCTFAFQGGEPTLAGLDFYRKLIEFQKKYNRKNVEIRNAIQTNGASINAEWAEFLAKNHFLAGLSLDGDKELHDRNRVFAGGDGSFKRVMNAAVLFNDAGVEYNVLCVVTSATARHARKIYNFFKKKNFKYLQFIPCLDPLGSERGNAAHSLTPEAYLGFLTETFELWREDLMGGNYTSVRFFDNTLNMFMGRPPEACGMAGVCSCQFVVEADGGVYPCDFYVTDSWKLGNILEDGFKEMRFSRTCQTFIERSLAKPAECENCDVYGLCRNGCARDREPFPADGAAKNYFCECYKTFYRQAAPKFRAIAASIAARGI